MLIRQKFIKRVDLKNNPSLLYVFGDNLKRVGMGGQAAEMRGEKNAVGIPTKRSPHMDDDAFLYDYDYTEWYTKSTADMLKLMNHHLKGGIVVYPADGIGTGLAKLNETSPLIFNEIERFIKSFGEVGV
jgi:hypothetical protein